MAVGVLLLASVLGASPTEAQSGTRLGGFSSGGGSGTRLSDADRERLALLKRQRAVADRKRQAELAKDQFKQSLVNLRVSGNGSLNSRQNRVALREAKNDYRAIRAGDVLPASLGTLNVPFRLTSKEINRDLRTATWPELLLSEKFQEQITRLDLAINAGTVVDSTSAKEFLGQLNALNQGLNIAASHDRVPINDYARARRFISGLANEIRASNLIM